MSPSDFAAALQLARNDPDSLAAWIRHQQEIDAANRAEWARCVVQPLWNQFINAYKATLEKTGMANTIDYAEAPTVTLKELQETRPDGGEYSMLAAVLSEAYRQSAVGKGHARHSLNGTVAFQDQRMQTICELLGSEQGMAYQVIKKVTEGLSLDTTERKVHELLGGIVYLAGIVIFLRERDAAAAARAVHLAETADDDTYVRGAPGVAL